MKGKMVKCLTSFCLMLVLICGVLVWSPKATTTVQACPCSYMDPYLGTYPGYYLSTSIGYKYDYNVYKIQRVLDYMSTSGCVTFDPSGYYITQYRTSVDGYFGEDTKRVIMNFQRIHGLTVDGIVGQQTWNFLMYHRCAQ